MNRRPVPSLSQANRQSLQNVYDLYNDLDSQRSQLAKSLDLIAPEGKLTEAIREKQVSKDYKDVKKSLSSIRWTGSKIRVSQGWTPGKIITDNWGDWSLRHPYRHFYGSRQEFQNVIASLNSMFGDLSRLRRQVRAESFMFSWPSAQRHLTSQMRSLSLSSRNLDAIVEMQVARTLLKKINQA